MGDAAVSGLAVGMVVCCAFKAPINGGFLDTPLIIKMPYYFKSRKESILMANGKQGGSKGFWAELWDEIRGRETLVSFLRFIIETLVGLGAFLLFVRAAFWAVKASKIDNGGGNNCPPEMVKLLAIIGWFVFAVSVVLFVLFVIKNSIAFGKILIRDIREELSGGSVESSKSAGVGSVSTNENTSSTNGDSENGGTQ